MASLADQSNSEMSVHTSKSSLFSRFRFQAVCCDLMISACLLLLAAQIGGAQASQGTGIPPFGTFNRDAIDTVNVGNLNVHLQFPMFVKKSIGFDYISDFVADNQVLTPTYLGGGVWSWVYAGGGWRLSTAGIGRLASQTTNLAMCTDNNNQQHFPIKFSTLAYVDSNNTQHAFPAASYIVQNCSTSNATTYYSADGYTLNISSIPIGGSPSSMTVTDHSGNVFDALAITLTDPNSNRMTYWTDTTGATPITYTTNGLTTTYKYPGPSGSSEPVTVTQVLYTVKTNFQCPGVNDISGQNTYIPTSIGLPDGTSYNIVYEATGGTYPSTVVTGRIHSLTLPSGATIMYAYSGGTNGINCVDGSPAILKKTTPDGIWTYNHSYNSSSKLWTTVVTDPALNDTAYTFGTTPSGAVTSTLETQRIIYQGSQSDNNSLKTIVTCYNGNFTNCATTSNPGLYPTNPISRTDAYTYLAGPSTPSLSEKLYSSSDESLLVQDNEFDYGVNTNAAPTTTPLSATKIAYASLSSVKDRPSCVEVTTGTSPATCGSVASNTVSITNNIYDTLGNLKTKSQWVSGTTYLSSGFTYNPDGLLLTSTDTNSNLTSYTPQYCGPNNIATYISKITTGSLSTTTTWDCNGGVPTSVADANSQPTNYAYAPDPFWRLMQVGYPDGGETTNTYNDTASPVNVVQSSLISSSVTRTTQTSLDGLGRPTQVALTSDPDPSGTTYSVTAYDSLGRTGTVYNPTRCNPPTTSCASETTWGYKTYFYNGLSRATTVTEQDASKVTSAFTGNCVTTTDEVGKARKSCQNALGQLTGLWEDPSGLNYETDYTYDGIGNLLTVTQKGGASSGSWRTRTFQYDGLSRLTKAINPESGTIAYAYTNAAGALCSGDPSAICQKTAPSPNQTGSYMVVTSYTYDSLNRLTSKSYTDSDTQNPTTAKVSYGYDGTALSGCNTTPPTLTDSYPKGRRTAMCDGSGATSWSHDQMGRIFKEERTIDGQTQTTSYTYYKDGSLNTLTYPGTGNVITYTVLGAGRPTAAQDSVNNYAQSALYAPPGELASMSNGTSINVSNAYNDRLQPILLSATATSGAVFSLCFDFHLGVAVSTSPCSFSKSTLGDNGNVYQIVNNRAGYSGRSQSFMYDSLNRIQQGYSSDSTWGETISPTATAPGVAPSTPGIDAWGNLTNRSGVTGKTHTEALSMTVSTKNQLGGLTYDAAGNFYYDGVSTYYHYDAENRLVTPGAYTYYYDGDGNRVAKSNGSTGTLYWRGPTGNPISESSLTGTSLEEYIFFNGSRIARRDVSGGAVHYYFSDHLGSHGVVENATGSSCEQDIDYYPYGGVVNDYCATVTQHYRFTGKERDSESGLDYFGARYNASSLGRMMSPDSGVDQHPEDPQSWNLYAYGRNNPLVMVDPTGEYVCGSGVTQTMCDNFQKELDAAQKGADALKDKYGADSTRYKDSQRAIDAYGKENVDNGVTVQVGNMGGVAEGTVDRNVGSVTPTEDNPNGQAITVSFGKESFNGSADNAMAVAHEGSHVADASDWVSSGFSARMNPFRYATENRALHVSAYMAEGTNFGPFGFMLGNKPQYIWKPGWTPAMVNSAINWELKSPIGPYHLTPNSKILAFKHNTKGGN